MRDDVGRGSRTYGDGEQADQRSRQRESLRGHAGCPGDLTATGRRFLPHARRLLATAEETAADLWPRARPLRIDVGGQLHVPLRIVRRLTVQFPQLVPELSWRRSLSAALEALDRDELDVAFGRPYDLLGPIPPGLALQPVYLDPLAVAMSVHHAHADAEVLTAEDLRSIGLWWPLEKQPR